MAPEPHLFPFAMSDVLRRTETKVPIVEGLKVSAGMGTAAMRDGMKGRKLRSRRAKVLLRKRQGGLRESRA
jgi:hypothetical protein